MKKLLNFLSIGNIKNIVVNTFKRFPVPVIITTIIAWILLYLIHWEPSNLLEENLIRWIFSLVITFFLSVWVNIFSESIDNKKNIWTMLKIASIIFWILFYITFWANIDNFENFVFFILTLSGIISFLFFSPYVKNIIKNPTKKSIYYTYFYNISVVFLTSFILGWVLAALWMIAISSVINLFDIDWVHWSKLNWDWLITSLSIITPIFALNALPNKKSFTNNYFNENAFFSFLVKYIATPFIYVYFIILYSYSIKVLSNFWDWPKWEVSWMVIWFSIFGYIAYIFSYIFEDKNKFIKIFRKIFPFAVIPQLFMLFYAIYLRINQYDLTINRYFVVVFGLWLGVISLYYIFSKKKFLSFIPAVLTLFTIIISVWPWSVYKLPETRQLKRLETNLETAWILKNWEITPLNDYNDISKDLSKNIYSWIDYLCDFENCKEIKKLFYMEYRYLLEEDKKQWEEDIQKDLKKYKNEINIYKDSNEELFNEAQEGLEYTLNRKYSEPTKWEIVKHITEKIKVKRYFSKYDEENIRYSLKNYDDIFPLNTTWYSKIIKLDTYGENKFSSDIDETKNNIFITVEWNKVDITFIKDALIMLDVDSSADIQNLGRKFLTFHTEKFKFIFSNITLEKTKENWRNKYEINRADWYVLLK